MSKGAYVGIGGKARKVKKLYVGIGGKARKIKKLYVGIGGNARLAWTGIEAGQLIFTESTMWTAPFDGYIDVFMVGGGKAGGMGNNGIPTYGSTSYYSAASGGAGGCSGKTKTILHMAVSSGQQYAVVVGAGGNAQDSNLWDGSVSSFGGMPTEKIDNRYGGSSGGAGAESSDYVSYRPGNGSFPGCSDGQPQQDVEATYYGQAVTVQFKGQGTTTRAFGESTGTLYAGGGGGGGISFASGGSTAYNPPSEGGAGGGGSGATAKYDSTVSTQYLAGNGSPNTGSGGGGGAGLGGITTAQRRCVGGNGGSGIVIIRWRDDAQ